MLFLDPDDYFLFDRGYRDAIAETKKHKISAFMPILLQTKKVSDNEKRKTQFTCEEANTSRKVTMSCWVIESVNGRIKNVFPWFKHTIEANYIPKIMRFNRIACSIMNAFFPLSSQKIRIFMN
jgi:hypothetical protein